MTELEIKAAVRERDGQRCTECEMTRETHYGTYGFNLDVHRIVPGSEYTVEGCVTLCRAHHGPKPKSPAGTLRAKGILQFCVRASPLLSSRIDALADAMNVDAANLIRLILTKHIIHLEREYGLAPPPATIPPTDP